MNAKIILICGTVLALGGVVIVFAHEGHDAITAKGIRIDEKGVLHLEEPAQRAIGIAHAEVEFGGIEKTVSLNAHVVTPWNHRSFVSSRLEGVVKQLLVRQGQEVSAGETLAVIESLPLEALRWQLEQSGIELAFAEENLRRGRELGERIIAGRELLSLETARDDRRNAMRTARKKLEEIGDEGRGDYLVTAPIGGVVTHLDVTIGQHVEPAEHLFEVANLDRVWVECEVPDALIALVALGQPVRFHPSAFPEEQFIGHVDHIDPSLDLRGVRRVWARLENREQTLLPSMFGRAVVVTESRESVFVVLAAGIVTDGAERYAFVRVEEGAYKKTNLMLGIDDGDRFEVTGGLYPGDLVVTTGNHELSSLFVQGTLTLSTEARTNIGLSFEEIDYQPVGGVLELNARVVSPSDRRAVAASRISGKVGEILVSPGEAVEADQPLATLSSLELQNAQLDLIQLHLRLGLLGKQLAFIDTLTSRGISARKELLRLQSESNELRTRVDSLQRSLLLMGLTGSEIAQVLEGQETIPGITVRAPIAGNVTSGAVVLGQVVEKGAVLFEIIDPTRLWIESRFFERDLAELFRGGVPKDAIVRTVAYEDREWTGQLSFIDRSLDHEGRTLMAWMEIDNLDGSLISGMRASLMLELEESAEEVIAVPLRALRPIGSRNYVFVEQGKELKRAEVVLGRRDAHFAEVLSGVFPGDRVVVSAVNEVNNAYSAVR